VASSKLLRGVMRTVAMFARPAETMARTAEVGCRNLLFVTQAENSEGVSCDLTCLTSDVTRSWAVDGRDLDVSRLEVTYDSLEIQSRLWAGS
jgi:hypothetical protein